MNLIELIQEDFPLADFEVRVLLYTAPNRYKLHEIEKRNGRGKRLIAQPTAEIKALQKWAVERFSGFLPVHDAATAYRKGSSIKQHASVHVHNTYLLKMDFKDFFPSIKDEDFQKHAKNHFKLDELCIQHLTNLFFRRDKKTGNLILSIGAPSSPVISNSVMYLFDSLVMEFCLKNGVAYSRYADDLAFSTNKPKVLDLVFAFINELCETISYPNLTINKTKTVFVSQKHSRQLTGLILSNDGKVSLGREKKRIIRATAHRYSQGRLQEREVSQLRGWLAYAYSIEPEYVASISRMIGVELFETLKLT